MQRRRLIRTTLRSLMFTLAVCYLGFHALHGDQGLYALVVESHRRVVLTQELEKTRAEREALKHRVALLRPETLDRDLLDEQARRYLSVSKADEIVVTHR